MIHDGPWFCDQCKGHLALHGPPDPTQDFALIDHLWAGYEPEDVDESALVCRLAEANRPHGKELQVRVPGGLGYGPRWVNVPPMVTREQLVADTHQCLGHVGCQKLLEALQQHHWWPGMYLDAAKCVATSATS